MKKREISSLLIKLLGIYCLFQAVPSLSGSLGMIFSMGHMPSVGMKMIYLASAIIVPLFWMAFCISVICKSDAIAKFIYKEDSDASQIIALNFQDCMVLGFCIIGVLLFVQSLPSLIRQIVNIRSNQLGINDYTSSDSYKESLSQLVSYLIQAVIGALMFFKANSLADLWERFQVKSDQQIINEV